MCLPKHNRIVLGTVQFGLPYGIANQNGQVSRSETAAILDHAWSAGLDTLDTAIAYGESEQRLGEINVEKWRVITKLSAIPENCSDVTSWAQKSLLSSLERLRIPKLYGMLLHRSKDLLGPHGDSLYNALLAGKDQGFVEKIGVSIYDPKELDSLPTKFKFDLVQAPYNIIDRRLALSGWLTKLHQAGTEIHVRSVFLQGLLLMKAEKKPLIFNRWQQLWLVWKA
jgi:aryl-alcohol dehydrogenase-like predicted oxidoreductase